MGKHCACMLGGGSDDADLPPSTTHASRRVPATQLPVPHDLGMIFMFVAVYSQRSCFYFSSPRHYQQSVHMAKRCEDVAKNEVFVRNAVGDVWRIREFRVMAAETGVYACNWLIRGANRH